MLRLALLILLALGGLHTVSVSAGDSQPDRPLAQRIKEWQQALDRTEKSLAHGDISDDALLRTRTDLNSLRLEVRLAAEQAEPELQAIRDELTALGPPPQTGEPPEAASLAGKRKAINDHFAAVEGSIKESGLLVARSERILRELGSLSRSRVRAALFRRGASPLNPLWWQTVMEDIADYRQYMNQKAAEDWLSLQTDELPELSDESLLSLQLLLGTVLLVGSWCGFRRLPGLGLLPEPAQSLLARLRLLLTLLFPILAATGFVSLASTLVMQTSASILLLLCCTASLSGMDRAVLYTLYPLLHSASLHQWITRDNRRMIRFWVKLFTSFLLLTAAILLQLVLWGAGGDDLGGWLYKALFGFRVGSITISLVDMLTAAVLFTVGLGLTRLLQRMLDRHFFPRAGLDAGVAHSVRASVGYLGFVVSAMLAISTAGFDLSSLAMIAGALSVGIGFGLQTIVNNFVSGLILLIERPIKVGDWIVVGDIQGYVKRISVRATEVSTFDQASVFIPNSTLVSNAVMNRTYADKIGRIVVPIGLTYGNDTRRVQKLLLDRVNRHPSVLKTPPPVVLLKEFAESAILFEVVAFIGDVDRVRVVSSELCMDIDETFRNEGLEMPYPQRDIHLKLDEEQLAQLVERS
ncbi:MAG: hypothetical protein RIQ52_1481 [Pseudomonadota bacterium]|jgi:small-conductance mechanosensitive channel